MSIAPATPAIDSWDTLVAPAEWRVADVISDLHLHVSEPATADVFLRYLAAAPFDALFILGDLFEVWIGDDVIETQDDDPEHVFVRTVCAQLRACAVQRPVYVMHGNRDFLLGAGFFAHTATRPLTDPTVLDWAGQRSLLTHGDAWCLDDHDYMRFRQEVRTPAWQHAFLARPLAEREAIGRQLRAQSETRKQLSRHDASITYADVDTPTARHWLQQCHASTLVHGHTHRPAEHDLGDGLQRLVLSDWDALAQPRRAEVLRLRSQGGWTRQPVAA